MNKERSARSTKCESCGDDMIFNPDTSKLLCPSCKTLKTIAVDKHFEKHDYVQNEKTSENNKKLEGATTIMKCPNCAAQVLLFDYNASSKCPYCDTDLVLSEGQTSLITPDAVIPFKFGKKAAKEKFFQKVNNNFFCPSKFKKVASDNQLQAYYFPAFTFDATGKSTYDGILYKDENDGSKSKRKYFKVHGTYNSRHKDVGVEASLKLTQQELNWIHPYNFKDAVKYSYEYISGYALEYNSSSVIESMVQAKNTMDEDVRYKILSKYHHDGVSYLNVNTEYSNQKYSYCMLPMYRINYTYKGKKYSNVMNGQTGAVGGSLPKSPLKICLVALIPIMIIVISTLIFIFSLK